MSTYLPPVDWLLGLGETKHNADWSEYTRLGLRAEHIPELIRMLRDRELLEADGASAEVFAPGHAARALGQLCAQPAVDALLEVLEYELDQDRDWIFDDFSQILAMMGPGILGQLSAFLDDTTRSVSGRGVVTDAMGRIALTNPDSRAAVHDFLCKQLSLEDGDATYNGHVLAALLDMQAVEALPAIEKAFAAKRIDPIVAGTWEHVQWELGGKHGPEPRYFPPEFTQSLARARSTFRSPGGTPKERAAARRKAAKKARKQQRNQRR